MAIGINHLSSIVERVVASTMRTRGIQGIAVPHGKKTMGALKVRKRAKEQQQFTGIVFSASHVTATSVSGQALYSPKSLGR
jgi:hypothetical protein